MKDALYREVLARLTAAETADGLSRALAPAFIEVGLSDAESVFLAEPSSLAVVEARVVHGRLDHRTLVVGDDVGPVWSERLSRARTVGTAAAALDRLEDGHPVALELLPRLQRWYLPSSGRIVELRGRREVEGARVLGLDAARTAVDAWLRVQADLASVFAVFGPGNRAIGPWLVAEGQLAVAPDAVGFRSLRGAGLTDAVAGALAGLEVAVIDRAIASSVFRYGRRELAAADGGSAAEWFLPGLGLVIAARAGVVTVTTA